MIQTTKKTPAQVAAAKKRDGQLEKIAQRLLRVETLRERGSDSLDFHDIGVASLREALEAAFEAGKLAAVKVAVEVVCGR